ncbi:MAG: YqgE/AlgH family protein [Planctomycetes bacterium]|nr:YqgE/AlgH family protein [Planctomycetota bacterium]
MAHEFLVTPGAFLAAGPELRDPNFAHTVVLICRHAEQGAYGLVLNRRSDFRAREVLAQHELFQRSELPLFVGGPVSLETLQILHRAPQHIQGGVELDDDLWIGGELDDVGRYAREAPLEAERNVRLFLGYSGWSPGQLELELTSGSWLPAPGSSRRVFQDDSAALWRQVVADLGPDYRALSNEPLDPEWN